LNGALRTCGTGIAAVPKKADTGSMPACNFSDTQKKAGPTPGKLERLAGVEPPGKVERIGAGQGAGAMVKIRSVFQ
jgi:hypothetical protein